MFCIAGCSLLRAEGFSCSLGVLYRDSGISNLQVLIKKIKIFYSFKFFSFNFWSSKPWIQNWSRIRKQKKCWIRIRIFKPMRIRNPANHFSLVTVTVLSEDFWSCPQVRFSLSLWQFSILLHPSALFVFVPKISHYYFTTTYLFIFRASLSPLCERSKFYSYCIMTILSISQKYAGKKYLLISSFVTMLRIVNHYRTVLLLCVERIQDDIRSYKLFVKSKR